MSFRKHLKSKKTKQEKHKVVSTIKTYNVYLAVEEYIINNFFRLNNNMGNLGKKKHKHPQKAAVRGRELL